MSVLIKDMKMPRGCLECMFKDIGTYGMTQCLLVAGWVEYAGDGYEIPDACPLVEVKTPHGRLIDADAFAEFIKDAIKCQKYESLNIDEMLTVADVLYSVVAELEGTSVEGFKNAPTVIEAEEDQEE